MIRTDVPQHPEIWGELCGWYRFRRIADGIRQGRDRAPALRSWSARGQLMVRVLSPMPALYRGFPLHPDDDADPYVFRLDLSEVRDGTGRVVFSREPRVGTTTLHLDLAPLSLVRRPATTNPRTWLTGAFGALARGHHCEGG